VLEHIRVGVEQGARLRTGGRPAEGQLASGAYVLPTLFDEVSPDMALATEEIFGPVLSVIPWDTEEEVLAMANDSEYGLAAAVYTNDVSTAVRVAKAVEAGFVWVNGVEPRWPTVPFGGWKNSGIGTEHSAEEFFSYTQVKAVNFVL